VRNSIQLPPIAAPPTAVSSQAHGTGGRNLKLGESNKYNNNNNVTTANNIAGITSESQTGCSRRLTRSAFTKTLLERESEMNNSSAGSSLGDKALSSPAKHPQSSLLTALHATNRISVFDVRGLSRLKETFSALDNSVKDIQMGREKGKNKDGINILSPELVSALLCTKIATLCQVTSMFVFCI
jgi:hypothetical protein